VTQALATKDHLKSISDLKPFAKNLAIGGPPEFKTRTQGLVGLKKNYGLTFKSFVPLDESGPLTLAALKDGKVQAADVFTTTAADRHRQARGAGDPKFKLRGTERDPAGLQEGGTPAITSTLNAISQRLTTDALLQMTRRSSWITPTTPRSPRPG